MVEMLAVVRQGDKRILNNTHITKVHTTHTGTEKSADVLTSLCLGEKDRPSSPS